MKKLALCLSLVLVGCTSMETVPKAPALPHFAFASLRGAETMVVVLDQRSGKRDAGWKARVETDVKMALKRAGAIVAPESATRFEVRILHARSDSGGGQWEGCVELTGRVTGTKPADASAKACVEKGNLMGVGTANNVLRLAYEDAMAKLLSSLDASL